MNQSLFSDPLILSLLAVAGVVFIVGIILHRLHRRTTPARRARKDLRFMAERDSRFEWKVIRKRAADCFYRMHASWGDEELANVQHWMTGWYWQNHQQQRLDHLRQKGLVRICDVKKIKQMKPLLFMHSNTPREHEGSVVVIKIIALMQDYLADSETGKRKQGSRDYRDIESVWSFTLNSEGWKLSDVEHASMAESYIASIKDLPKIEETLESG